MTKTLSKQELITYLKKAIALEADKLELQDIQKKTASRMNAIIPKKNILKEPSKPNITYTTEPLGCGLVGLAIFGFFIMIMPIYLICIGGLSQGLVPFLCILAFLGLGIYSAIPLFKAIQRNKKNQEEADEIYRIEYQKYNKLLKETKEHNAKDLQNYTSNISQWNKSNSDLQSKNTAALSSVPRKSIFKNSTEMRAIN